MNYRIAEYYKNFYKPENDICINCKNLKPISDIASIQYQDGKIELGHICKDCYQANKKLKKIFKNL